MKIFLLAKLIVPENANRYWRIRKKENDDNWKLRELSDELAIKIQNGIMNRPGRNNLNVKDINVVNLYESDKINPKSLSYIDVSNHELEKFRAQFGDVFITRSSLKAEGIAHPNILLSYGNYVFDDHIMRLRFLNSNDPYFMSLLLSTKQAHNQLMSKSKTGSMTTIGHKDVETINILRPGKVEQNNISKLFNLINQTITLLQKKSDQLNTLKKALLQKMFADKEHRQPKLRFKGFSGDWELRELRELSDVRTGKAFKSSEFSDNGKYKVITNKEISDSQKRRNSKASRINIQNLSDLEKYKLDGQNILVTMDGVNIGKVKRYSNANAVLAQRVGRLNAKNIDFIFSIVDTSSFINKMQNLAVGNAIKHISLKQISGYTFKSPVSEDEQNKIGRLFIKLDKTVELHQHKLVQLQTLKKSLLQTMFV